MANRLGKPRALPPKLDAEAGPVHSVLKASNIPDSPPIVFCIIQWNLTNKRLSEVRWHLIWVVGNQWKSVSWREGNLSWADNLRWMCWGYRQCQFSQRWTELRFSGWKSKSIDLENNEVFNRSPLLLAGDLIFPQRMRAWKEKERKKGNYKGENKADVKGNLLSKLTIRAALM